jgi:RNA polymerase II subunit A small phosphatase-like protein
VSVRPGASEFIELLSEHYDVILFTASLKEYADPVMDILDVNKRAVQRLFREHCVTLDNALVKDLRVLEKDLSSVIIIDV